MDDVDRQVDKIQSQWEENEQQTRHTSWRQEYLEMKAGLSKLQIRLLKEGPSQLAQAWLLQAMHNDYKKMKGIKTQRSVNCQRYQIFNERMVQNTKGSLD